VGGRGPPPRRVAADDPHGAGGGRHRRGRRHELGGIGPDAEDAEDALAETEHVRHARAVRAQEDHDPLIDHELRSADEDAAEAAEVAAGHAKAKGLSERALEVVLDLERDDRLDRAAILGPLRVERQDAAADDRARVARQLAEVGWNDRRRAGRHGEKDREEEQEELCSHQSPVISRQSVVGQSSV